MPVNLSIRSLHRGKRGIFAVFTDGTIRFRTFGRPNWRKIVAPKYPHTYTGTPTPMTVTGLELGKSHIFAVCSDGKAYCRKYGDRTWAPFDGPTA